MRKALLGLICASALLAACSGESVQDDTSNTAPETVAAVSFTKETGRIEVLLSGQPFTAFHYEEKWDKPFLYPLRTSSGIVISRGYPIEPRPGEERDHDWHRGIWYGHGDVNGHDFWRELGRDKTSLIVPVSEPAYHLQGNRGTISAELALKTEAQEIIGTLREDYSFSKSESSIVIDVAIAIRADKGQALRFGDTDDGGFAMRLADQFRQDHGAVLLNSEGEAGTENIWGKPAKWIDYSATMEGKQVGVTMFDHPSNPRHPSRWHARGYSLCSANPFGLASFTGNDKDDGSYTLPAGQTMTFRYRVIIHEAGETAEQIEQLYNQYASSEIPRRGRYSKEPMIALLSAPPRPRASASANN